MTATDKTSEANLSLLRAVCTDPQANPLAVAEVLDISTSREWRDWEPDMIRSYVGLKKSDVQLTDKIMATQVGVTNPDVYEDWHLFAAVSTAFNHRRANFQWLHMPQLSELAWTCICLRFMNGEAQFGNGVIRFIGSVMITDGLVYFPWVGGEGLHLCHPPVGEWARGLVDDTLCTVGDEVKKLWKANQLQSLTLDNKHDETDPFHVQLYKVVAVQQYLREQRPRHPSAYLDD